jgi:hypothetical protein
MKNARQVVCSALLVMVSAAPCRSQAQPTAGAERSGLDQWPHDLETTLALSAAPPYLRSEATVYVLDPAQGYVLAKKGSNGFTCYVQRTDYTRAYFRQDYVVPECQDAEGSRTIAPVEFEVERLRAAGKLSPSDIRDKVAEGFRVGVYHSPSRPGIAYMLAPVAQLNGGPGALVTVPMNMPHIMFFAPNLSSGDVGGGPLMGTYPYIVNSGPMAYMIVNVGETEKARIHTESRNLLSQACDYRAYLCLRDSGPEHHER